MAVVQVWGCKKCSFVYNSPAKLRSLVHHCPPKSHTTAAAILLEGEIPPERPRKSKPALVDGKKLVTKSGKVLTEDDMAALVTEAEAGYDVAKLKPKGRVLKRTRNRVK